VDGEIIHHYGLQQALEDGVLIPVFVARIRLVPPQPIIVMTISVAETVDRDGLQRIWDAYCNWFATAHQLPEEERLFAMDVADRHLWVIEDAVSITFLLAEDY
jgi:hypothetical protein